MIFKDYQSYSACPQFMNNVFWGNLFITSMFAVPIMWIFCWMILIKGISLILGLVAPGVLIWIKKKLNAI
jgi:hypothetical protein